MLRGLGPARQVNPIPLDDVHGLQLTDSPFVPKGPVGVSNMFVLSDFFLMRELEASLQLLSNTTISAGCPEVFFLNDKIFKVLLPQTQTFKC